jgi:hypothetical protein
MSSNCLASCDRINVSMSGPRGVEVMNFVRAAIGMSGAMGRRSLEMTPAFARMFARDNGHSTHWTEIGDARLRQQFLARALPLLPTNWIRNNRQDPIRGGVHSVPRELCLALLLVLCSLWALARLVFFVHWSCCGFGSPRIHDGFWLNSFEFRVLNFLHCVTQCLSKYRDGRELSYIEGWYAI